MLEICEPDTPWRLKASQLAKYVIVYSIPFCFYNFGDVVTGVLYVCGWVCYGKMLYSLNKVAS